MSFLNNLWYEKTISSYLLQLPLLPFSSIFAVIAAARRSLYANGFCKKSGPVVPVVVVGGVTVGGTGKTPICIALVKELKARGFNPGVLTRGYKAHCRSYPCQVPLDADPYVYGDEPSLIRRETKAPVVIDPKRTRGADYLSGLGVDVIITDDGLQHYALDRDVEICVLDGSRMLGNGHLLPAGPLREAKWRLKTVDSIVVSGAVAHLGYFPMMLKPSQICPLNGSTHEVLDPKSSICALSGIGNPDRFYKTLEDYGFVIKDKVDVGDHGRISIDKLKKLALQRPVVMTAKDAIKYQSEAVKQNLSNIFVLNVSASLSKQFYDDVVNKIKQSNYKVAQRRKKREAEGYVLEHVELIDQEPAAAVTAAATAAASVSAEARTTENTAAEQVPETEASSVAEGSAAATPTVAADKDGKDSKESKEPKSLKKQVKKSKSTTAKSEAAVSDIATSTSSSTSSSTSTSTSSSTESTDSVAGADAHNESGDKPLFGNNKATVRSYDPTALPSELKRKD